MKIKKNKKAIAWQYIVGAIIALLGLFIIAYIIFKSNSQMSEILEKIKDIF